MKSWFTKFRPFILITTFVAIVAPIMLYTFQNYSFTPVTIDKTSSNLSPAGNLTGTWSGTATFKNTENPSYYCTFSGNLTLKLTQSGNQVNGQFIYTMSKGVPFGDNTQCTLSTDTYQISAKASGSRIENLATPDSYGTFMGSFTNDTITLNQSKITSLKLVGPANLLRQ